MTMRARGSRSKWQRHIEATVWVAGIGLFIAYGGTRWWYAHSYETALAAFEASQSTGKVARAQQSPADVDMSTWSMQRIERYREAQRDALAPQAVLRIPSLKLIVPVFDGTSELNLNRGAGRIEGTAHLGEQGNVGIAAHRDGFFRALKDVRVGDELIIDRLTDKEQYRVASIDIVDPSNVGVLDPTTTRSVTLVTCYPFYHVGSAPKRFIVKASIVADSERKTVPALAITAD